MNIFTIDPHYEAVGVSFLGPRRNQEDSAALVNNRFAVFDGLGGHEGGELASAAAVAGFSLKAIDLRSACFNASRAVREAQKRKPQAMTTLVAVEVHPDRVHYAWAGDSRFYLFRPLLGLTLITKDHTVPGENLIIRCLGCLDNTPDFGSVETMPGDVLLLCSDGLYNAVSHTRLEATLTVIQSKPAMEVAQRILKLAERDACDNTTVVIVKL